MTTAHDEPTNIQEDAAGQPPSIQRADEGNPEPGQRRPYLEPDLDRWKAIVLALLFCLLLFSAMAG